MTGDALLFERYTDRARRVIVLAQQAARDLSHACVGTEHLAAGLIGEGGGVAFQALSATGLTGEQVREAVSGRVPPGQQATAGHLPFTPGLKRVLQLAIREALQLGCNYVATEHLLLSLIRDGECTGAQVLADCAPSGVGLEAFLGSVRAKVLELLRGYADSRVTAAPATLSSLPWRAGTHNGRTLYAVTPDGDHYSDVQIGTMDTFELAAEAVAAHNDRLARRPG
jgi:ATP-dependent Clp protease ATP-binding subunit ClpC